MSGSKILGLSLWLAAVLLLEVGWATPQRYTSNQVYFTVVDTPDWVKPADLSAGADPARGSGESVAYLLTDKQIRVEANAETRYVRRVVQALTETGLDAVAEVEIEYNPAFQELTIHKVAISRAGLVHDRLDPARVKLIQRETELDKKLYDGTVTALIFLDDVRVNDVIDVAYSVHGSNPVFGDRHFSAFSLGWGVPVDHASVRIIIPKSRKLRTRAYGIELEPTVTVKGSTREYLWVRNAVPAVINEGSYPDWYQPYPWVQVAEYRNWGEVADWVASLYAWQGKLDPQLLEQIEQWRAEKTSPEEVLGRALRFVQGEIRYLGIELGQNSHRPSHPNEVFARRYGDCKDKALLLTAILSELGITARPALVSTNHSRALNARLASPGLFDHVIVMANLNGRTYWLDATRSPQYGPLQSMGFTDYGYALVSSATETGLVEITRPAEAIPTVDVGERFVISSYETPVEFTVESTYTGSQAESMRQYFASFTKDAIAREFLGYYANMYPSIVTHAPIAVRDDKQNNSFTIQESYSIPDFWKLQDERRHASLYGSSVIPHLRIPQNINRTAPVAVNYPIQIRQTSTLVYPEDIDYEDSQSLIRVEDQFVSYHRKVFYAQRRLTVEHLYRSKQDTVMPDELAAYVDNLKEIDGHLYYDTWVQVSDNTDVDAMVTQLLDRLQKISD